MISYAAALEVIAAAVRALAPRRVSLPTPRGVAAATEVRSTKAVPAFANAAMDGFALRSADTLRASAATPVRLAVAGRIAAGQSAPSATPAQSAWEIMTGAPLPGDCDAVIPLESAGLPVTVSGDSPALLIREPLSCGQNRRNAGEDFGVGDVILRVGDLVTPQAVMALAAAGCDAIAARGPIRVAVVATGNELPGTGADSSAARIRDANGPYLAACLETMGIALARRETVADDPARLAPAIESASRDCDIVLTTGGVSAGRLDFVPATVERLRGEILFHKVAIRPGKPVLFARLPSGALLFGLPGNPMAVAVGLRFFVVPAVRALLGQAPERYLAARAAESVRQRPSVTFFAKAAAQVNADATLRVRILPGQESFKIRPLLHSNCWAILRDGRQSIVAGDIVEIASLLPGDFPLPDAEAGFIPDGSTMGPG